MGNCSSRNKVIIISLILILLIGCKEAKESYPCSNGVETVLSDYIGRHPKDSILFLQFYKVENRTFLNVQHYPFYPSIELVDGGFFYKDKLVTYCLLDKRIMSDSLIYPALASDKTILNYYKSWDEANVEYDGNPDSETYLVKSRDKIVKAKEIDFEFKEKVSDTTGIRNRELNDIINKRLNNHYVTITAIRFASFEYNDYFMVSEANVYTRKNLSGCLRRNGRIITFYGVENLNNKELVNKMLIQKSLSLLDNYKELSNDWFNRESGEGDIYKILPRGNVEKVSIDELSETECSLLYEALGL